MKSIFLILISLFFFAQAQADINVYTDRSPKQLSVAAAEFEKATGEKVFFVHIKKGLVERVLSEGPQSPGDVVILKDMYFLNALAEKKSLQAFVIPEIASLVNSAMVHPESLYTAISYRARTLVYSTDRVRPETLPKSLAELANPKWKGKLCLRTSSSTYNKGLVSSLVLDQGVEKSKKIVRGWVSNLAAPVFPKDRNVLSAIVDGECEIGLVNSYYLANAIKREANYPVSLHFLNQTEGVHVNGVGAGILAHSKKKEQGSLFISMLLTKESQRHMADAQMHFPARLDLEPNPILANWGEFVHSLVNWNELGASVSAAEAVMAEAGYE